MLIEIKGSKAFVDADKWGIKSKGYDMGDYILNILFYCNRDGSKDYQLIIDGVNETDSFKSEVKKKYQDIRNTELRDKFFMYARVH